jgi:hypothetical protein
MTDRADVLARLGRMPDRLSTVARAASPGPPAPGEWTPADVVRHLITVEFEVWHRRLAQLAAEEHPHWPWAEPDRWTGEPGASLDRLLEVYGEARGATVATLSALDVAGWARTGTHATFGVLDVAALMTKANDHDDEHIASLAS